MTQTIYVTQNGEKNKEIDLYLRDLKIKQTKFCFIKKFKMFNQVLALEKEH